MNIAPYATVLFIAGVVVYATVKRTDSLGAFTQGAKQGLSTCVSILPNMAAMLIAVSMFRQSGLMDLLVQALKPAAVLIGLPPEALPIAVIRPLSGSAALAVLADTMAAYGADSAIGRAACIIMGSSETLFYTTTIYFGSVHIQKWRHTIAASLLSSLAGIICAAILC